MGEYAGRLPLFHIDLYRLAQRGGGARRRAPRRPPGDGRRARSSGRTGSASALPPRAPGRPDRRRRGRAAADPDRGARRERSRGTSRRRAGDGASRWRGRRMSDRGRWLLALDTATATIVVAAGTPDGAARSREEASRAATGTRRSCCRRSSGCMAAAGLRLAGPRAGSSSGPGRARSPACGSASPPRRPSPTSSASADRRRLDRGGAAPAAIEGASERCGCPSGPRDRVVLALPGEEPRVVRDGETTRPATRPARGRSPSTSPDRAPEAALDAGPPGRGRPRGARCCELGAARLARGERTIPERLVPRYASPPRGGAGGEADGGGGVVARPPVAAPGRADDARRPARRPRHRAARASPCPGRTTPTATSSRRNRLASYVVARAGDDGSSASPGSG